MLGELSHMLITGQKALPHKLMEAGFTFQYPSLKEAFQESLSIHHPTP